MRRLKVGDWVRVVRGGIVTNHLNVVGKVYKIERVDTDVDNTLWYRLGPPLTDSWCIAEDFVVLNFKDYYETTKA